MTHTGVVTRVTWRSFRVPFRIAFRASRASLTVRQGFVVTIETSAGLAGVGEASPLPEFGGGTLVQTAAALEKLAAAALGRCPEELWADESPVSRGTGVSSAAARAGMETALADILAKAAGLPLWRWLEHSYGLSPSADSAIPVNATIDASDSAGVAGEVRRAVASGFEAVKLKVGSAGDRDIDRVAAARASGGDALAVRIDANGAWSEEEALAVLAGCAASRVSLCEQPLDPRRPDLLEATAWLRGRTAIPIGLDESCRRGWDVHAIIAARAADTIVVKPMLTGLREAVEMIRVAGSHSLPAIVTTTFDAGLGTAMATHLAALLPTPRPACGLATLDRLEHGLVREAASPVDGRLPLGADPGLGTSMDEVALARYTGPISGSLPNC